MWIVQLKTQRFPSRPLKNCVEKQIATIVRATEKPAAELQALLKSGSVEDRNAALTQHASKIADCLVGIKIKEVPVCMWWIAKAVGTATDTFDPELVDLAEEATRRAPYVRASVRHKMVVNTLKHVGRQLVPCGPDHEA